LDTSKLLNGLKVLDLSSVLAGPQAASFFAELGARVIKVENKLTGGDVTRQWKMEIEDGDDPFSSYYWSANYGKEVHLLDLTNDDDKSTVETWISRADIVISNFPKRTAEKLGFCPYRLHNQYPQLIIAHLSAYEYDDPRPGYDLVMQAETGWISMTGTDENNLAKLPVALIDIIAAHQIKEAVLLALYQKQKTGLGSLAFISLYKSAISALANQATNYLMAGHVAGPMGTLHPNIAPYGDVFTTQDQKKMMLAIGSDGQFEKLCHVLKMSHEFLMMFSTNTERLKKRNELQSQLNQVIEQLNSEKLSDHLKLNHIPHCFIKSLNEVLDHPEASDIFNMFDFDGIKRTSVKTIAFQYSQ
jgi:crotonobetainyl-CoA:carnitine CoA-transferase CaiB-like acyl-CoA transferase